MYNRTGVTVAEDETPYTDIVTAVKIDLRHPSACDQVQPRLPQIYCCSRHRKQADAKPLRRDPPGPSSMVALRAMS
jgi:hypothetical protein